MVVLQRLLKSCSYSSTLRQKRFQNSPFSAYIDKHSAASAELLLLYSREFSNQKIRQVEVVEVSERKQKLTLKNVRLKIRRL